MDVRDVGGRAGGAAHHQEGRVDGHLLSLSTDYRSHTTAHEDNKRIIDGLGRGEMTFKSAGCRCVDFLFWEEVCRSH